MNNKGFTLIELVATIALLAVISVISFVSINAVITESKVKDCESLVNNIKSATKEYVSDNRYNSSFNKNDITIDKLNLSSDLINPFTKEKLSSSDVKIEVTLNTDYTVKTIDIKNSSGNIVDCSTEKW